MYNPKRQKSNRDETWTFTPETHLLEEGDVNEKIVTLFISAHGSSVLDSSIPRNLAKRVIMLNFAGGIHTLGRMARKCPELTIEHGPSYECSNVTLQAPQIDIMSLQYVHHVYRELAQSDKLTPSQISNRSLKLVYDKMPLVYANKQIPYFHSHHFEDITSEPQAPFTLRHPTVNKYYTIAPGEHENCSSTNEECKQGLCRLLPRKEQFCPEYGITVVYSTQEEDMPYTLAGVSNNDNSTRVNLNDADGRKGYEKLNDDGSVTYSYMSVYDYWKQRLTERLTEQLNKDLENMDLLISDAPPLSKEELEIELNKIYDDKSLKPKEMADKARDVRNINKEYDNKMKKLKKMRNKITGYYEYVIGKYETMASELTETHKPEVQLSDIIEVFIGMGFDKIHIIDPTCNSCEFPEKPEKGSGYYKAMGTISANDIRSRIASGLRPQYNRPAAEYYTDDFDYEKEMELVGKEPSVRKPTIKKKWSTMKATSGDERVTPGTLKRGRSASFGGRKYKTKRYKRNKRGLTSHKKRKQ